MYCHVGSGQEHGEKLWSNGLPSRIPFLDCPVHTVEQVHRVRVEKSLVLELQRCCRPSHSVSNRPKKSHLFKPYLWDEATTSSNASMKINKYERSGKLESAKFFFLKKAISTINQKQSSNWFLLAKETESIWGCLMADFTIWQCFCTLRKWVFQPYSNVKKSLKKRRQFWEMKYFRGFWTILLHWRDCSQVFGMCAPKLIVLAPLQQGKWKFDYERRKRPGLCYLLLWSHIHVLLDF